MPEMFWSFDEPAFVPPFTLDRRPWLVHPDHGVDPRQTSSGPSPAGTRCEAKGGILPDPHVYNLCVAACTAGESPVVRAKEM